MLKPVEPVTIRRDLRKRLPMRPGAPQRGSLLKEFCRREIKLLNKSFFKSRPARNAMRRMFRHVNSYPRSALARHLSIKHRA